MPQYSSIPTSITWGVGQTLKPLIIVCVRDDGLPQDFTGLIASNIAITLHPTSGTDINGAGTITIINAAQGVLQYNFAGTDVATAGQYTMWILALYGSGLDVSSPIPITIVAR